MELVPAEYKLWETISLMFWNGTNISKLHVDVRDYNWSMVMPYDHFIGGDIDLKYLNTLVIQIKCIIQFVQVLQEEDHLYSQIIRLL